MKKLVVVLIMGLCGSTVFAQDSSGKVEAKQEAVLVKTTQTTSDKQAVQNTGKKGVKLVHKLNLQSAKAAKLEKTESVTNKSAEK